MFYTVKYNNANSHRLDDFDVLNSAVASAKALHHPDWPVGQGIRVKDSQTHKTVFNSRRWIDDEPDGGFIS